MVITGHLLQDPAKIAGCHHVKRFRCPDQTWSGDPLCWSSLIRGLVPLGPRDRRGGGQREDTPDVPAISRLGPWWRIGGGERESSGFSSGSSQDQRNYLGTRSRRGELRTLLHKGYDFRQWLDLQPVPANLHAIP